MTPLFKNLNFKNQKEILILNSPQSFNDEIEQIKLYCNVVFKLDDSSIEFVIIFVTQINQIEDSINLISSYLVEDPIIWYCYPKSTSKKYKCEFNRDNGWEVLGKHNLEPVRQVSIDEDWSALRFRKVENIKKMVRSFAITKEGKKKVEESKN